MCDPPSTEHVAGQSFSVQLHWLEVQVLKTGKGNQVQAQPSYIQAPVDTRFAGFCHSRS